MTSVPPDRRKARHEAKRAEILLQAWLLAHRDGLAAISLRDLADSVGLRQPSLYVYFDSKLALYDGLFADGYRQLLEDFDAHDYTGEPRGALVRFLADQIAFASNDIVRHQMLFQRTIPGYEPSPESWALALEFYEKGSAAIKAAGIEEQADLDVFTAIVSGMSHQQVANDPGGSRWVKHAERAVDMFLAATATPQPQRVAHSPQPPSDSRNDPNTHPPTRHRKAKQ
jgi:AcrR family transcriptional regulator